MAMVYGVIGATGIQGGATLKALVEANADCKIRAFTRDPSSDKAKALSGKNVEVVKCDLNDKASLVEAFRGCKAIFAVTDFWISCAMDIKKEIAQGKNIADAAKEASVEHLLYSTLENTMELESAKHISLIGGYRVPHFDGKGEVDAYMKKLSFPKLTLLYTSFYLENLTGAMKPAPVPGSCGPCQTYMIAMPVPKEWELPVVSAADIGRTAANLLLKPPAGSVNVACSVSEWATVGDICQEIGSKTGTSIVHFSPSTAMFAKFPFPGADDFANMFQFKVDCPEFKAARSLSASRAIGSKDTIKSWVEENKGNFF